jgi:nucleoside-diphosphate-sugar epimerase
MQRVLIIGASGYIGGAIARRLLSEGVRVTGLSRSRESDALLRERGVTPVRGAADATAILSDAAQDQDGVVYAARYDQAELSALAALADVMAGRDKPLVFISGASVVAQTTGGAAGSLRVGEHQKLSAPRESAIRLQSEDVVRCSANAGVRGMAIRPPIVYGHGRSVQIPLLAAKAREHGAAGYVGAGQNRWSFIHVDDLAELTAAALRLGRPGAVYHATAGDIDFRTLAAAVAQTLGLEAQSLDLATAEKRYGKFAARVMLGSHCVLDCFATQADLGWQAARADLIEDIRSGSYAARWSERDQP